MTRRYRFRVESWIVVDIEDENIGHHDVASWIRTDITVPENYPVNVISNDTLVVDIMERTI
jgi:hypothetical protein